DLLPLPSHLYAADFSDVETSSENTRPTVSRGPYVFDDRQQDEFIRFVANDTYYLGRPQIDTVVFRVMPDPATRVQAMQAGEADYMVARPDEAEQFGNLDEFNVFAFPNSSVEVFAMNWADPANPQPALENGEYIEQAPHPIFGDVRVRQAVAMGYDKSAILESLGENGGQLMAG